MSATVHKLVTTSWVGPGDTFTHTEEDIPDGTAYSVDVHPFYPGSEEAGYTGTTVAEVTRFRRRTRKIEKVGMRNTTIEAHNDVIVTVKNVGDVSLCFDPYLIVFS